MSTRTLPLVALLFLMLATASSWAEPPFKRLMYVHRVQELGLEIRTEVEPRWETSLSLHDDGRPMFTAETPAATYPFAGMTWTVPGHMFEPEELAEAARGALSRAASNYGLSRDQIASLSHKVIKYGSIVGYETDFSAVAHGTKVDVKVFFGHQPGKPVVVMQAFTLKGKLPHLSEQIRRSWTNVRYLKD